MKKNKIFLSIILFILLITPALEIRAHGGHGSGGSGNGGGISSSGHIWHQDQEQDQTYHTPPSPNTENNT